MPIAPRGRRAQGLDESRLTAAGHLTLGEAKRVIPMMARIGRLWPEKAGAGRMPSSISACTVGTMPKGEASRVIPWCEARSERPHYFDAPSRPFLPLRVNMEGAGGTP